MDDKLKLGKGAAFVKSRLRYPQLFRTKLLVKSPLTRMTLAADTRLPVQASGNIDTGVIVP